MKTFLATTAALGALTLAAAQTQKMPPEPIQRHAKADRSGTAWFVRAADGIYPILATCLILAGIPVYRLVRRREGTPGL